MAAIPAATNGDGDPYDPATGNQFWDLYYWQFGFFDLQHSVRLGRAHFANTVYALTCTPASPGHDLEHDLL